MSDNRNIAQENTINFYSPYSSGSQSLNPTPMDPRNRPFENTFRSFSNQPHGQNFFYSNSAQSRQMVTARRFISTMAVSQHPANFRTQDTNMDSSQSLENAANRGAVGINPMLLLVNHQTSYNGRNPHAIPQPPFSENLGINPHQLYISSSNASHESQNTPPSHPSPSYTNGMIFRGGVSGPGGRQEPRLNIVNSSFEIQPQPSYTGSYVRSSYDQTTSTRERSERERQVNGPPRTTVRPQFRSKVVCQLACKYCHVHVCRRGMKAILLADTNVELYSTDSPPAGVQLVNEDYTTRNCHCRIRDVACLGCGNVVGYHVTQPCETCLEACNNGHFWMFHVDQVGSSERMDNSGSKSLLWAQLPRADRDIDFQDQYELMCR